MFTCRSNRSTVFGLIFEPCSILLLIKLNWERSLTDRERINYSHRIWSSAHLYLCMRNYIYNTSMDRQILIIPCVVTKSKPNLHCTRRITPKRVTSCGAHLRGLAPGLHNSEETSQRWQVVGDTVDLTGSGFELQTSRTDSVRFAT